MDLIKLTCVAVEEREGYTVVYLNAASNDPEKYAAGTVSFTTTIEDGQRYEIDKDYSLQLKVL